MKRNFLFIYLICTAISFGCSTFKNGDKNPNDYDYITTDIYLSRDTIRPSPDVLFFIVKINNLGLLNSLKNSQSLSLSLKTSFTRDYHLLKIKRLADSCYSLSYPTGNFILNKEDIKKPLIYNIYSNGAKLKRNPKSQRKISHIKYE